eukprot:jgi/Mesen1/3994/ME000211S03181
MFSLSLSAAPTTLHLDYTCTSTSSMSQSIRQLNLGTMASQPSPSHLSLPWTSPTSASLLPVTAGGISSASAWFKKTHSSLKLRRDAGCGKTLGGRTDGGRTDGTRRKSHDVSYSTSSASSWSWRGAITGPPIPTPAFGGRKGRRASPGVARARHSERERVEAEIEPLPEGSTATLRQDDDELSICRVVNGLWQTSGGWGAIDRELAADGMLQYADRGYAAFDLADNYGPAEDIYGMFIDLVRRQRGEDMEARVQGMTRSVVQSAIDTSRRRMDVKALDMLQFQWWDFENKGYVDALKHLTDLKEEGKIQTVGLTNFDTKHLQVVLEQGIPVMASLCALTNVQFLTYGTLLGGLLAERFIDVKAPGSWGGPPLANPAQVKYKAVIDAWGGWPLFQELLRAMRVISRKYGAPITAVGVRHILDQPCVAASMIGVRMGISGHIKEHKYVFTLELDEEDRERLQSVLKRGRDLMNVFGDCGNELRK